MIAWLNRNSGAMQAAMGALTALIAVAALIGVKVQIDANEAAQRAQSARDIYREFLNLSISQPKFAAPDYCAIADGPDEPAYDNYVQYMLYASEQILASFPDWEPTLATHMKSHREIFCGENDWTDDTQAVQAMIGRFRGKHCTGFKSACP